MTGVAYIHTWNNTQDEGWVRYAFDYMGIPYTYLADQRFADTKLLDNYDVVIFPSAGTTAQALLATKPTTGKPIPWKKTAKTPNLGTPDSTDDTRGSMGLDGVMALERFISRGGLFITETLFGLPGIGQLAVVSIGRNDFPMVMGVTVLGALFIAIANLVVDVTYAFLDPRVRYT